jgi:hypothetical protein
MDWWKKTKVPGYYKLFAASYRYGFEDAAIGRRCQVRTFFSNEEAWNAYKSGYVAGETARREKVAQEQS